MKLLIAGSRTWDQPSLVKNTVQLLVKLGHNVETIIEGGARGADRAGRWAGEKLDIPVETVEADWDGPDANRAGMVRNGVMADMLTRSDFGLLFLDRGWENSRGTSNMYKLLRERNIPAQLFLSPRAIDEMKLEQQLQANQPVPATVGATFDPTAEPF